MAIPFRRAFLLPAAALLVAAGCDTGRPGAGLTNGPPPGAGEKAAVRTDLPAPAPETDEAANAANAPGPGGSDIGTTGTQAGTGGRGGGRDGGEALQAKGNGQSPFPPSVSNAGPASGGTKAPDNIQDGTPRSPH